jgi:hypothetical protein
MQDLLPRVQPVAYTTAEFERAYRRGDRLAREAVDAGIVIRGDDFFAAVRAPASGGSRG